MANVAAAFEAAVDLPTPLLDVSNSNLSNAQKELLTWHNTLGHIGFAWLQELMSPYKFDGNDALQPAILQTKQQTTRSCTAPRCNSCLIANGQCCSPTGSHSYHDPASEGVLKIGNVTPGNKVSTNQYES
eukprot:1389682-Ditylum_brightwellii.AAC.1